MVAGRRLCLSDRSAPQPTRETVSVSKPGEPAALLVAVRVTPGAARPGVGGVWTGTDNRRHLVVRVRERAVDGAATAAVTAAVAEALGVAGRRVVVRRGTSSRVKLLEVEVEASARADVERRLAELLASEL